MVNILTNVDISDLITVNVYKGNPLPGDPCPLTVTVDPIDQTKRVVFDTDALKTMNAKLTEKIRGSDPKNPNTAQYIKEYVTKMVSGFYKNGLLIIEDMPEAPDDPYKEAKAQFKRK